MRELSSTKSLSKMINQLALSQPRRLPSLTKFSAIDTISSFTKLANQYQAMKVPNQETTNAMTYTIKKMNEQREQFFKEISQGRFKTA